MTVYKLSKLITNSEPHMAILTAISKLQLNDCYIAAGCIRNMVWDHLHQYSLTPFNDIDVIFFSPNDYQNKQAKSAKLKLQQSLPQYNWQVKNQAFMHLKNGDRAYQSSLDAMSFWPEKETAIGARLNQLDQPEIISPFDTSNLFKLQVTHNPKRSVKTYLQRVKDKDWLNLWPQLSLSYQQSLLFKNSR